MLRSRASLASWRNVRGGCLRCAASRSMRATARAALPFETAASPPPQRLCSLSSGLPLLFVPEHSVEDGEDLAADGDESNHFWLTDSEQALIEGTQYGIAAAGGKRGQEDRRARDGTTAGYHAPAFPLAGLACERRDASQACDLAAREAAEFGDICQEGASEPIADTRERDQQVLLFTPNRRAAHHGVDVAVDDRQFLLESCNVAREAFAHAHGGGRVSRAGVRRPASR